LHSAALYPTPFINQQFVFAAFFNIADYYRNCHKLPEKQKQFQHTTGHTKLVVDDCSSGTALGGCSESCLRSDIPISGSFALAFFHRHERVSVVLVLSK
jgi:hypothetical protein